MASQEDEPTIARLEVACKDLKSLLRKSADLDRNMEKMDKRFDLIDQSLSLASRRIAPLQSMVMANKALDTRINRAITPALSLIHSFRLFESLQADIVDLSARLSDEVAPSLNWLERLLEYINCVDQLNTAVRSISEEGEPAIQKLQEVVEFLSRTKATDNFRTHRLRETLVTLKALYETEVDAMRFEGLLDEALLQLQDEYEGLLQQLKHENVREAEECGDGKVAGSELGSDQEVEALRRISETLAANDCLDICIDIFIKVRYRRAAKALMRLNPEYLKTYTPEEIDKMEWESLETAITLWIQHFELALKTVLVSERRLCNQVLGGLMDGLVWPECFVKIADKIMAVFFRFGEGVARSKKEPQKLFKLLDMFDSLEKLKAEFIQIFEGESGTDICIRFRELEKLLVAASSKVFWEFGLQIEGNSDGLPPPQDGSVLKLVRYAINYLKYLVDETYSGPMAKVLQTEQVWRAGILSKPELEEDLLRDAVSNVMEALQRNVESKRGRYKEKILPHVFAMNTYWYIYMRTRNTELGKLLGEKYMKKGYKVVAEESAYLYQKQAWGSLVRLLEAKADDPGNKTRASARMEAFLNGLEEASQKHRSSYAIPDADLREQIKEATVKLVVPAYAEFVSAHGSVLKEGSYASADSIRELLSQVFEGGDGEGDGKRPRRRGSRGGGSGGAVDGDGKDFRRSRSDVSDLLI
ncbi:exocyst complex component EXO70I-like [Rhodamnia argentea]|uniref:Exocyst subunit Exo70 family protein n=1 Tax=Rhodamnia argentea TaxID=178133 RepID=A0A8B8PU59_9MYRT|nr:exocyst complex component EXO70I-like [Rhodamnia argentea]